MPMVVGAVKTVKENVRRLPTTARPKVDARDVIAPPDYTVDVIAVGLSFPCGMTIADDGTIFIAEGGTTWPTRPWMPSRLLRLETNGEIRAIATESEGGLGYHDGYVYAMAKGGYTSRVLRFHPETGERTVLFDTLPNGGWHEPGGPVFDANGIMYFSQGSVAQQGVIEPAGFTVDIARHPYAKDIPGQDVTLTGNNVWSFDPVVPYSDNVGTGPFKPYGQTAKKAK